MNPLFVYDKVTRFYIPANKDATALSAILSKMRLRDGDMIWIRAQGYTPRLTNGDEICKTDIKA